MAFYFKFLAKELKKINTLVVNGLILVKISIAFKFIVISIKVAFLFLS